jgi:ABC-type glycerol-3-phosphate transport system permease component
VKSRVEEQRRVRGMSFVTKIFLYTILLVGAFLAIIPFWFMLVSSFKSTAEIFTHAPLALPLKGFHLTNFVHLFTDSRFGESLMNSTIVSVSYVALILFLSSLTGFAFAKYRFPGNNGLFTLILLSMMIPPQIAFIPLFMFLSKLGLSSTYFSMVVPRLLYDFGLPFSIFLMRQYASYIPDEVIDSAKVDGCNKFTTYRKICLPLIKPGLLVVGLIVFMACWNDFMWPLIIVNKQSMYTVALTIARLFGTQREVDWGQVMSACFMSSLPLIVLFVTFRRTFIAGITSGAIK